MADRPWWADPLDDALLEDRKPEHGLPIRLHDPAALPSAIVNEYVDVPIDLRSALWLATANDVAAMPAPLLDRIVVDVSWPDRDGSRVLAEAVAAGVLERSGLEVVADDALDALLQLSPRRMRRVRRALELAMRDRRCRPGFVATSAEKAR